MRLNIAKKAVLSHKMNVEGTPQHLGDAKRWLHRGVSELFWKLSFEQQFDTLVLPVL
jgi:hypothetical protein